MADTSTAWSYSRLALFESCARLFQYRNIRKLDEPKHPAMFRGIKIHNEAAAFLDSNGLVDFPESCIKFEDQFRELIALNPVVEQKWGFDKKMKPTGWMSKNIWLRATLDAGVIYDDGTGEAIDHKTGKRYDEDYSDQLNLFAHSMFRRFPFDLYKSVTVRLWYLDSGDEVIREISKGQAEDHFEGLKERAEVMMKSKRFPPRPSWKCRYCHFSGKNNGGPCEY